MQRGTDFLKRADALFKNAAAEPQSVPAAAPVQANQGGRRNRVAADDEPGAAPVFPAGKMTPWQQYAQALLSAGEFYYVN